MNKRGLIKFLIVLTTVVISFYYIIVTNDNGIDSLVNTITIFNFLFALTIFMFSHKDKIKKNKFIYDVILMLLMIFSISYFLYFVYAEGSCYFSSACEIGYDTLFTVIYIVFLFTIIFYSLDDIFHKTNKTNDFLTIAVSLVIILIHLRYYFEPNFVHKLVENRLFEDYSYYYVVQNYVYFSMMYFIILLHYRINKEN